MAKLVLRGAVLFSLLITLAANVQIAQAQTYTPPPHFSHIVIIIQENRTPDTLFGDGPAADPVSGSPVCAGQNGWAANIDLQNGGPNNYTGHSGCSNLTELTTMSKGGGSHSHLDWTGEWDGGLMDGACNPNDSGAKCGQAGNPTNPPYVYIQQGTVASPGVVLPYFQIAQNYGWANYMFQTNEGPSYPAQQFLFGGTSAPAWPTAEYGDYFVANNASFSASGCTEEDGSLTWIDPTGKTTTPKRLKTNEYECFDRNTMVTTQNAAGTVSARTDTTGANISWSYYAQTPGIIWDAPESLPQTCYGLSAAPAGNPACSGSEFSHVIFPGNGQSAPIFSAIANCSLPEITWVTPDAAWSDHPGDNPKNTNGLGPSWVTDIIDAIGQSAVNSGGKCDYWNTEPTAIFVTWDDWGGFYDHVPPPAVYRGTGTFPDFTCPAPNSWGCGYVYGFRVPLLVVSPYTPAGYVSGPISTWPPTYPPPTQWTHDFGSILAFTEQNFYPVGSQQIAPAGYTYADSNALDATYNGSPVVPLWDFFTGSFRAFTPISAPYSASYFEGYYDTLQADGTLPKPAGPDADDNDDK